MIKLLRKGACRSFASSWRIIAVALVGLLSCSPARADYSLAEQYFSDAQGRRGFRLYFEGDTVPPRLKLQLGDGVNWRWLDFGRTFPFGVAQGSNYFWVKAVVPPSGQTKLYLNDQLVLTSSVANFAPFLVENPDPNIVETGLDWQRRNAPSRPQYVVRQTALRLSHSSPLVSSTVNFPPSVASPTLFALTGQNAIRQEWPTGGTTLAGKTVIIEASFYLEPTKTLPEFTSPVVDAFGQSREASWSGKVSSSTGLKSDWQFEVDEYKKAQWQPSPQYDAYGGYITPTWKPQATGFYRVAQHPTNRYWWLITPSGNPCFYIGIDSVVQTFDRSLYTDRTNLFPPVSTSTTPPDTHLPATSHSAWGGASGGKKTFGFLSFNLSRRYGSTYPSQARSWAATRTKAWGFSGFGKWSGGLDQASESVPVQPVVKLPSTSTVPRIAGTLYDIDNPGVATALRSYIAATVGPHKTNPKVIGWSFGNETDGIVWDKDIVAMLRLPNVKTNGVHSVPAKHELVNYACWRNYGMNFQAMADAWQVPLEPNTPSWDVQRQIELHTFPDVDPDPTRNRHTVPQADITAMRRNFASKYYAFVRQAFKDADPNHLYFGFWISIGTWQEEEDWNIISRHCDVVGYDYYGATFADARLSRLIKGANKPVLCGEFSFPASYDGQRGYGYYGASPSTDAASGQMYRGWAEEAAKNPLCVGMHWFELHDQPVLGRAEEATDTVPLGVVMGEHYAFGLADITDRPKWEMLPAVRQANLNAAPLRLSQPQPTPTPTPQATSSSSKQTGTSTLPAGSQSES